MAKARELVQHAVNLFNQGDMDGLIATYTDDAIEVFPSIEYKGRAGIGERLREQQDAFPDRHIRPIRWVEDGDTSSWSTSSPGRTLGRSGFPTAPCCPRPASTSGFRL